MCFFVGFNTHCDDKLTSVFNLKSENNLLTFLDVIWPLNRKKKEEKMNKIINCVVVLNILWVICKTNSVCYLAICVSPTRQVCYKYG